LTLYFLLPSHNNFPPTSGLESREDSVASGLLGRSVVLTSHRLLLALALIVLAATTVACGSGGGISLPNPQGNFSNASLSGSYVYEIQGFDTTVGNPYRQIGVFTADGNGNITGGSDDSSFSATGTSVTGSYRIAKDGTGLITINTSLGSITLAVTLASTSRLQLIESDAFVNAGGTAELQSPSATSATPNGSYVFRMHQEVSAQSQSPAAEVGGLSISGGSATGSMDENHAGVFSSPNVTATFGTPSGLGRGTGTLVNSSTNFTTNFVYYVVDGNTFVFLVTNVNAVGSGRAEMQSGSVGNGLSGNYAFGSRGDHSTFFAGIATIGQFNAASGTLTGTLDSSQDGTISSNANFSFCYTSAANGRVLVKDLSGNTCSNTVEQAFWMVNPSRAFFVNAGGGSVEDGTADLQQSQNFLLSTFTQQYSIAMDGWDVFTQSAELLSRVGTLQFDGAGKLTLNEVVNASSSGAGAQIPTGGLLRGTYSTTSNGRIVASLSNSGGALNLVLYAVSGSEAYVLQTDPGSFTSGMIQLQQ
jgi:hypothetical protein